MLTSLLSLIAKEYRQTFRDKRMVWLLLMAPVFQLILLGFAVNLDVDRVPLVVADEDHTRESRALIAALTAGKTFTLKSWATDAKAAVDRVERGEASLAVVVPRGFAEKRRTGRPATIQALVDGSDTNRAIVSQNAMMAFAMKEASREALDTLSQKAAQMGRAPHLPTIQVVPRIFYNPTLDSRIYFVPGVASTLLLVVTLITTAMGLAREKEMGTLEQVMVSPIRPEILILGKTLPYGVFGLIDLGMVVVAGAWIFDVPIRGSVPLVFLAGMLYMLTTLGVGLLVSTLARTQQQAFMGAIFFLMPAVLLSGFVTPIENMPEWLQPFSNFTPVRHFVTILRAVLLKNSSIVDLKHHFIALAGLGLTVYATSAYLLRRRLS